MGDPLSRTCGCVLTPAGGQQPLTLEVFKREAWWRRRLPHVIGFGLRKRVTLRPEDWGSVKVCACAGSSARRSAGRRLPGVDPGAGGDGTSNYQNWFQKRERNRPLTMEEIENVTKKLPFLKTPGPDGVQGYTKFRL
ncbi:mitochondrial nicotinamide adenine dinucleotide transporter SLC25A51 isoform X3 [Artibeus jamaicensis]|uniref:mitochondrial nicotinamide adenine dinucleotide transporter SLC25A51 isoform X3 n=1 Tax=Artibeus jamaicensis TaxID=9417 RepID=UPI00235B0801|nr:mitochondrial nicotinamide adenine dinucleotide transporter SLC25A51 isoform X3 [Artibeus jamaicensis]